MTVTMLPTDTKRTTVSPVQADGPPSLAKLSNISFISSDPTVFTVAPDSTNPATAVITGVGAGTAILTSEATATEPDGVTTEDITGALTVVLAVPPPNTTAAALVFSPLF